MMQAIAESGAGMTGASSVHIAVFSLQPIVLIECPRLLFPFAREIVATAVRNGGFAPLLLDPIDFVSLYRQRLAAAPPSPPPQPVNPN